MSMNEITARISQMNQELEEVRKEHMRKLQEAFREVTKEFFNETPVQAVIWTQYTPYFNDGEECVFGVNDPIFVIKGFDPDNIESDAYDYEDSDKYTQVVNYDARQIEWRKQAVSKNDKYSEHYALDLKNWEEQQAAYPGLGDVCDQFKRLLMSNDEVLRDVYGDHVKVVLTKDGATVDEYEHD